MRPRKNNSRVSYCRRWCRLEGEADALEWRSGGVWLPPGPAVCRGCHRGVACAGLEAGGGDVVLPVAHLQLEVVEPELEEGVGRGHHIGVAPCRPQQRTQTNLAVHNS